MDCEDCRHLTVVSLHDTGPMGSSSVLPVGHCPVMHRKLKLAPSPTCPCGQEEQTTEHVLQRYPLYKATREDVWPVSTSLTTKFYGCKQELEKTTSFISRAALIVQTANAKKKKKIVQVKSYQWLQTTVLQWLPCQAPDATGPALELVGPASVYCEWAR